MTTTATQPTPQLLTRQQAAEYLGLSRSTLEVWACTKRERLPYIKLGRSVRYRRADLDAFISRGTVNADD